MGLSSPGSRSGASADRILLLLFGIPFLARLLERLTYLIPLSGRKLDFTTNYGITEWLINYSDGFQRRGLPGQVIHVLYERLQIAPNLSIIWSCLILYLVFCIYLWRRCRGIVARWVLFTTPLLGYAVFIDRILIRKDLLILLIFALCVRCIASQRRRLGVFLAGLLLAIGILSHEIIAFLGLPSLSALLLLREADGRSSLTGLRRSLGTVLGSWLLPLACLAAIAWFRPTASRAKAIALSWRSAFAPDTPYKGPEGAIAWLAEPVEKYISDSQKMLHQLHFGIPYWVLLVLASVSGIVLLAAVIGQRSRIRAWFFVAAALLQFLAMSPLFFAAWDHGRWVVLCLLTAFVLAIETPLAWQERFAELSRFPARLEALVLPGWIAPAGLAFWGIQVVSWSPYGWLASAPVGFLLQIYFWLRVLGMDRPF